VGANTRFAGLGTTCGGTAPACCIADFDQSGVIDALDIYAFLDAWFGNGGGADLNGVPGLSADDVFRFMEAWFDGC